MDRIVHHIVATDTQVHWLARLRDKLATADIFTVVNDRDRPMSGLSEATVEISAVAVRNQGTQTIEAEELRHLPSRLRTLHLAGFRVPALPDDFWALYPRLHVLKLQNLGLTSVPDIGEGQANRLMFLSLSTNALTGLPGGFWFLDNLASLSLRNNTQLRRFPAPVLGMVSLQQLNLDNTRIRDIPRQIGNLTSLESLTLTGIPTLQRIPPELLAMPNLAQVLINNYWPLDPRSAAVLVQLEARGILEYI